MRSSERKNIRKPTGNSTSISIIHTAFERPFLSDASTYRQVRISITTEKMR